MAKTSDYKRGRSRRVITSDQMFLKGMYNSKHVIPMGYASAIVNYEVSHDGLYIHPRKGVNTFTEVARVSGSVDIVYSGNAYYDLAEEYSVVRLIDEDRPVEVFEFKDGELHGGVYSIVTNYVGTAAAQFDGNSTSYEDILFSFGLPSIEFPESSDFGTVIGSGLDFYNSNLGGAGYYLFDVHYKDATAGGSDWATYPEVIRAQYGWFDLFQDLEEGIRPLMTGYSEAEPTTNIGMVKATKIDATDDHDVIIKPMHATVNGNMYAIASEGPFELAKLNVGQGDFIEVNDPKSLELCYIAFEPDNFEVPGVSPDCVIHQVKRTPVTVYEPSYNTAISTGYNMLKDSPYEAANAPGILNILGIIPFNSSGTEVQFGSIPGEELFFKGYFNYTGSTAYQYKWEIINAQGDATIVRDWASVADNTLPVTLPYAPAYSRYQMRLSMREDTDDATLVTSITPILSAANESNLRSRNPINYDLTSANGMFSYKEMLGLYGVTGATNSIFFSDIGNPGYFPFPNNVVEFNDRVLSVKALQDSVMVLCSNSLHILTGGPLVTELRQSIVRENFSMDQLDAEMAIVIKDAIFFRANDAFYWLSPNRYTDNDADLVDVKVSSPIEDLLQNPIDALYPIIERMFDVQLSGDFKIIDGNSYTDKERIHMLYKFTTSDNVDFEAFIDFVYNISTRQWTVQLTFGERSLNVYEPSNREYIFCTTGDSVFAYHNGGTLSTVTRFKSHHYGFLNPDYQADVTLLYSGTGYATAHDGTIQDPESEFAYATPDLAGYVGFTTPGTMATYFDAPLNNNFQFMDTGIVALEPDIVKRFRELQFTFYNKDGDTKTDEETAVSDYIAAGDFDFPAVDPVDLDDYIEAITEYFVSDPLKFFMDFHVDGTPKTSGVTYEVKQITDELSPDYGKIYVERTEQANMETTVLVPGETKLDYWELDFSQFPDLDLAKLRIPTEGKGRYPSMTLLQKSAKGFNYLDYAIVYRIMNSR